MTLVETQDAYCLKALPKIAPAKVFKESAFPVDDPKHMSDFRTLPVPGSGTEEEEIKRELV